MLRFSVICIMKYRHIFFDLDHTLWDFDANARSTLLELHRELDLEKRGVHDFDLFHSNYLVHNEKLWERYRKGFVRQDELRFKRIWLSLLDFRIADEGLTREMSDRFLELLPTRTQLFPYAIETLKYLREKGYELHLITNGFEKTQHSKLKHSGLDNYFCEVITSECSNCLKPQKEIFEFALNRCCTNADECIMIGDSLEVDIEGARNAGIDQVYVNHIGSEERLDFQPTYTVTCLSQLQRFL